MQGGVTDQALAERHRRQHDLLAELHRDLHLQLAGLVVQQQDAERTIVDDTPGELSDSRQQLIEIEDRRDLAPDLSQELEGLGVLPLPLEEPRIDERGGDVRRKLTEDRRVAIRVAIPLAAEDVERANRLRLVHERHGDGRHHAGHDADVVRFGRDVADDERLLRLDDPPDDALRQAQRETGRVRIAFRVADTKFPPLLVEQIDGEGVERDEAPDQLRDALQELLDIDHRNDLAAQVRTGSGGSRVRSGRRLAQKRALPGS